jgi:hypothetical protein
MIIVTINIRSLKMEAKIPPLAIICETRAVCMSSERFNKV